MDLPLLLPALRYRSVTKCAHTVSPRTHPCISSLYMWAWPWSSLISAIIFQWSRRTRWNYVDLAVHNFCSRFDSEPRRNVRKKYKVLTLETKIKLLEDVDTKAMTLPEIFEKNGVHKKTVSKTIKNRQQVEEAYIHSVFSVIESEWELAKWRTWTKIFTAGLSKLERWVLITFWWRKRSTNLRGKLKKKTSQVFKCTLSKLSNTYLLAH